MSIATLTPADDIQGCPFPFLDDYGEIEETSKPIYKIYNDGGHYVASKCKRIKGAPNGTKQGYERTGLDMVFDDLYFQAYKKGLKDSKLNKPMTEYIKAGILKLYEGTSVLEKAIHKKVSAGEQVTKDTYTLDGYIGRKIKRKQNNLIHRKKRFKRKANINRWNYFVTFTYDDTKQSAESFKKKLKKCLANLHTRRGWKYMGVFELSPEKERVHFHGLLYVPDGQMIGKITEKQDYSLKTHKMQVRSENSFFEETFGRNDFCQVSMEEMRNGQRTEYIIKYIGKTNERITYSRGIPTEIYREIDDNDIVTEMQDFVDKYVLFDDVIDWERDIMSITDLLCNQPLTA